VGWFFIKALNRRNVFRVAIAYLAAAWLLIEVAMSFFLASVHLRWGKFIISGSLPCVLLRWSPCLHDYLVTNVLDRAAFEGAIDDLT